MGLKYTILKIAVAGLRVIYAPFKLQGTKNRIVIVSRQSNKPSMDIRLLESYLREAYPELECKVLCKFLDNVNPLAYLGEILKQMKYMASSKVILVDGYCIAASILNHKKDTRVVQMWHALAAIKKFGYQTIDKPAGHSKAVAEAMCMHRNYDYVISPSEATGEHFCSCFNVEEAKLKYLALPRVDEILRPRTILPEDFRDDDISEFKKFIRENYEIPSEKEIVLYVPTFRKGKEVALDQIVNAIDGDRFTLVVKAHPVFKEVAFDESRFGDKQVIIDWKHSSYQWLSVCDRVVSDYSALGVEAALTNKPLYYFVYDIDEYQETVGLNLNPLVEMASSSAETSEELKRIMGQEYDFSQLKNFRDKYVSVNTDNCTKELGDFIAGLTK